MNQRQEYIGNLDREGLKALWAQLFGRNPPPRLSDNFMRRALAYEAAISDSPEAQRLESELCDQLEDVYAGLSASKRSRKQSAAQSDSLDHGACIIKDWGGETHRIAVLEKGFEYRGALFRSLSRIAREITGTNWSGPAFFGLKRRKKKSA